MTGDRLGDRRLHGRCWPSTATSRGSSSARCRWSGSPSARSSARGWRRWCSPSGSHSPYAPLFGLLGALLAGGVLASGLEGVGLRAPGRAAAAGPADGRRSARRGADGVRGARRSPGSSARWRCSPRARCRCGTTSSARRSCASSTGCCRPRGRSSNALARFDPLPSVRGPAADVPAPTRGILAAPGVRGAAARAWCGCSGPPAGWGSRAAAGWRRPGMVVTNAHVVAGESDTDGRRSAASAPGLPAPGDRVRSPRRHRRAARPGLTLRRRCSWPPIRARAPSAAILGYPLDGPFDAEPGRIGQTETVSTQDAYGNGPVLRSITAAARAGAARQLGRADGRRPRSGGRPPCSRRSPATPPGRRVRGAQRAGARTAGQGATGARGTVVDRPLRRLSGSAPRTRCTASEKRRRGGRRSASPPASRRSLPPDAPRPSVPPHPAQAPRGAGGGDARGVAAAASKSSCSESPASCAPHSQ